MGIKVIGLIALFIYAISSLAWSTAQVSAALIKYQEEGKCVAEYVALRVDRKVIVTREGVCNLAL